MTKNVLSDNSQSCRLDSNVYSAMFNYQYPPTSRKHALKLQTSQVLHVENKKIIKNNLDHWKNKHSFSPSPRKIKKFNPFSSLALQLLSQLNNYIIFLPWKTNKNYQEHQYHQCKKILVQKLKFDKVRDVKKLQKKYPLLVCLLLHTTTSN